MGDSTSKLGVQPRGFVRLFLQGKDIATIRDCKPMENIMPFGQCQSILNPQVAAATAANWGKLQPMPCMPKIPLKWIGGSVDINALGWPVLKEDSILMCMWGGKIEVNYAVSTSIKGK
jgi:hypothetical protein